MTRLLVDNIRGEMTIGDRWIACAIGRSGICPAADKREGDGHSPLGEWPIRAALLRPDRHLVPPGGLPWRWLRRSDGWSDDPRDPAYNRPVRLPHPYSAERLWREDGAYDAILILGHNDHPPVAGLGSAIFLHVRGDGATEGCVAIGRRDMDFALASVSHTSVVEIR